MPHWDESETAQLRAMDAAGLSQKSIQETLGRSLDSITARRRRIGSKRSTWLGKASFAEADLKRYGVRMGWVNQEIDPVIQTHLVCEAASMGLTVAEVINIRLYEAFNADNK